MEKIPKQTSFSGLRIVLYGPESTGKTTLGKQLARHYQEPYVPEFARNFLQEKYDATQHICTYDDILPIAVGQRQAESLAEEEARQYVFLDTNILETAVYSHAYFNEVPNELNEAIATSHYDLYLLMDIDVEWTPDDLRDKPHERLAMFELFEKFLLDHHLDYKKVSGIDDERFKNAVQIIEERTNEFN